MSTWIDRRGQSRATRARARTAFVWLVLLVPGLLGALCEGDGARRPGSVRQGPIDPSCAPIGGPFPSGFDLRGAREASAVAVRFFPAGLLHFDLSTVPPRVDTAGAVPELPDDSDGDGLIDEDGYQLAGLCPERQPDCRTNPVVGGVDASLSELALVTTSGYEQVLFYEPETGELQPIEIDGTPIDPLASAGDWPLMPPPGESALRTALSTFACVYPPVAVDSNGDPFGPHPFCEPDRPGFLTRFTADTALAAGRLFVATSNLYSSSSAAFRPGTVLVFEYEADANGTPTRIRPDASAPVVFTTAYNPTGTTAHRTPEGRELILVTLTGSISVFGDLLSDSAVEVIDAAEPRVVARIPLGRAGASFGEIAVDPRGQIGMLGVESSRQLLAVDLGVLDDPRLYEPRSEPVVLDGSTPGFPDARIFDAEHPFELGRLPEGPPDRVCIPRISVTLNHDGERAYATDWCDGTIVITSIDWSLPLETPLDRSRFSVVRRVEVASPKWPANFGLPAAPGSPLTREGVPGIDYDGPDLFYIINEPEGQLCAVRAEL
jgi:hypothetical protein